MDRDPEAAGDDHGAFVALGGGDCGMAILEDVCLEDVFEPAAVSARAFVDETFGVQSAPSCSNGFECKSRPS